MNRDFRTKWFLAFGLFILGLPVLSFSQTIALDSFNRPDNFVVGNDWVEAENAAGAIRVVDSLLRMSNANLIGREWAYRDIDSFFITNGIQGNTAPLTWAFNMRIARNNPDGFDAGEWGIAYVLGKTTTGLADGEGYAVILGEDGPTDQVRLVHFTGGLDQDTDFTPIVSYSFGTPLDQFLSVRVDFDPGAGDWTMYVENNTSAFPQTDPRNTSNLAGTAPDLTYTGVGYDLRYTGALYNHGSASNAFFDEIYVPFYPEATVSFVNSTFSIPEANTYIGLPLQLTNFGNAPVIVTLTATPINAEPGEDYVLITLIDTFVANATQDVTVLIKNDLDLQSDRFEVTVSISAGHAKVGAIPTALVRITDTGENLPVEWTYFDAQPREEGVLLTWGTAAEKDNDYFSVERSADGQTFESIGQVDGAGNSDAPLDYAFLDQRPLDGANYYRLRQVDFDGTQDYSAVRVVVMETGQSGDFQVFPNPAGQEVNLAFPAGSALPERVQIFSTDGRLVKDLPFTGQAIPVHDLNPGYYWLQAGEQRVKLLVGF